MKNKSVYNAVVAFSLVVAILIGSFLAVAVISNSTKDNVTLYGYKLGVGYTVAVWMTVVSLVLFLAATFLFKKNFKKKFNDDGIASNYAKLLVCLSLIAYAGYAVFYLSGSIASGYSISSSTFGVWNMVVLLSAIGSAVYLALSVFMKEKIKNDVFAILSLLPVLGLIVRLVLDYLIQNVNTNGDVYRFHLLAVCALILFAINETRFLIDKAVPSIYAFFGLSAALFNIVYIIPTLALTVKGYTAFDENTVFCLLDMAFVVYVYIRLFSLNWRNKHEGGDGVGGLVAFDENNLEITLQEEEKNT